MVDGKYINNDAEYTYVIPVVCNGAYNSCVVIVTGKNLGNVLRVSFLRLMYY